MFTRYLKTGMSFAALFGIYFIALVPLLIVRTNLENKQFVIALFAWGILAGLFFIPAAGIIIRKVWFFKGNGEPVVIDLLVSKLMEINAFDTPVEVRKQRKKMVVTWRINDQNWCERIEKVGMKRLYELWLRLDNNTKTVTMSDKYRSVNWDLSPISVKTGWLVLSKTYFRVTLGDEWGVENYEDTAPEDYNFTPEEIKSPVMNTLLKNGWNVRFNLF